MSGPDWSKAPAGATHWGCESDIWHERWFKRCEEKWTVWVESKGWVEQGGVSRLLMPEREKTLISRPAKPRWRYHWGGPCPDFAALIPEYMMRDGYVYEAVNLRALRWDHIGSQGDIIAYRLPD